MGKTTGLGQGVGLLFDNADEEVERYFECDINKITPNKYQPRTHFNEDDLQELSASIKEKGIIQPLVVVASEEDDHYELIAGERRLRASKLAGLANVPVVVYANKPDDDELLELALIENIQRTDLNPIEEAEAYNKLIEKFGYTQEQAAERVGKKRSTVTNRLRLMKLPDSIKQDVITGSLSEGHARVLLRLIDDPVALQTIRNQIINKKLSVRQTENLIRKSSANNSTTSKYNSPNKALEIPTSYARALTTQLTNKLHSKVAINQNGGRGKVEIEYYSLDDLERLIALVMNE